MTIDEAIKNYEVIFDDEKRSPHPTYKYWLFVKYNKKVYYEVSENNPNKSEQTKSLMLKNIREKISK